MPTVLVVDDSAADRRLVCELLRRQSDWAIDQAATGVEALARIKDVQPDILVTDLQMPKMDGLELVMEMRTHFPDVPVILMTAYGSETLATEALERGAAGYVPKAQVAFKLLNTMENVLALAHAERSYKQLVQCLSRTEFTFFLENDPALIDPLVNLVQQMVASMDLCDFAGRLRIGIALKEALLNALFHGNLEIGQEAKHKVWDKLLQDRDLSLVERRRAEPPYRDRKILVDVKICEEEARFVIRDEGAGFDVGTLPKPDRPECLEPERGRGIPLMRTFMDEVAFNDAGNEVTMVKRRDNDRSALAGAGP